MRRALAIILAAALFGCATGSDDTPMGASLAVRDAPIAGVDRVRVEIDAPRGSALHAISAAQGWTAERVVAPAEQDRAGIDVGTPVGPTAWFSLLREDGITIGALNALQYAWESHDGDPYFLIQFLDTNGQAVGMEP